ncbi:ABC transporter ATP-binding protein, partial [Micromonospora sp. AP08]
LRAAGEAGHLVACHLPAEERTRLYQQDIAQVGVAR